MTDNIFIMRVVICTLAFVMCSVIAVLLSGLFHPAIDNKEIFTILGPAFQMVTGAFIGIVSSRFRSTDKPGEN